MGIEIHNLQAFIDVDLERLSRAAEHCAGERDPDLTVSIVDDRSIHEINHRHLGHDFPTDVLAFDYREDASRTALSGEVILSAETALRTARKEGVDPVGELFLYLVHGVLHLKGFDDKDPARAMEMERRQRRIMEELGF